MVLAPCAQKSLESLFGSFSWGLGQSYNLKAPSYLTGEYGRQNVMKVATASMEKTMILLKSQRMGWRLSI